MATFRNYEPRSEGLNAAYDLLLRAELAKAQAMGGAFAPLTDAIRSGQQMKIARDEQARLTQAQAEDSALRTQRMGLDTRELDLREKTLNRSIAQDDVMARAIAGIDAHFGGGTPFQGPSAAMGQRTPLSAGGLLGGGGGQIDPATLAAMGPENASRYMTMQNTIEDNQRAAQKYADEQRQKQQVEQAFNSNLAAGVAGKVKGVYEDKGAGIRARFAVDPKAASEELAKAQDAHLDRVGMQRKVKNDVKELRAAILQTDAESELKNRLLDGLELQVKSLEDIDPEVIKKNLEDARSYVYGTDTQSRSQRKSEADKQAEADANSPFKYITNRQEYKKGGFIGNASPELQAQVKLQAMKLAAEAGDLRDASLMLQSANPSYAQIKDFYGQMNAAEQDAIKTYEKAVWASGGWKPEVIADQSVPVAEGLATEPTGVPFPAPNNAGPSPDPMAPVPGIPNTPSPAAGLASTPPDVRSAMAAAMREGKSKEEIRAIYEQGRKAADMAGSVTTKPAAEKPLSMEERSRDFLIKNRLSKLAPQEAMQVLAMPSSPKAIREYLVFKGFKEGNALNETVNEIMRHINTFKTKTPK